MIDVKAFRQKGGLCGPATLKMVLEYYGIKKSEAWLARTTKCRRSFGIEAEEIIKLAKKLGLKAFFRDFCEISNLRYYVLKKGVPVIVDWFAGTDGHYSVVVDIDKENIYLQDPGLGHLRAIKLRSFKRIWFDFYGNNIKSKDDMIIRRMIVIKKK